MDEPEYKLHIVRMTADQTHQFHHLLSCALEDGLTQIRIGIDYEGVKLKVENYTWSRGYGTREG